MPAARRGVAWAIWVDGAGRSAKSEGGAAGAAIVVVVCVVLVVVESLESALRAAFDLRLLAREVGAGVVVAVVVVVDWLVLLAA